MRLLGKRFSMSTSPLAVAWIETGNVANAMSAIRLLAAAALLLAAASFPASAQIFYPGINFVSASSGNVANATATATMPAVTSKTNNITGFEITAGGATAGAVVNCTLTGLLGGTLSYAFTAPLGAAVAALPVVINFNPGFPASAPNTAVVLSCPALGAGNTNAAVNIRGYVQ
jgi:hypothetical protein